MADGRLGLTAGLDTRAISGTEDEVRGGSVSTQEQPALAVEGIKKQFGQVEVLKGVSVAGAPVAT